MKDIEINKIYNEDCLEGMKRIEDKSIDMILCDLPYGTTKCKWDTVINLTLLWEQYERIIKDNGAIILFGSQPFTSSLIMSNIKDFRYEIIWEKSRISNFMFVNKQIGKAHENICVFYKKQPTYNPQMEEGDSYKRKGEPSRKEAIMNRTTIKTPIDNKGTRYPRSVRKVSFHNVGNFHPTQKPTELLEWLIKTYSNEGELVLDNCMGSGSTGIACVNTNRNYIGFELQKEYFDIAQARIHNRIEELNNK